MGSIQKQGIQNTIIFYIGAAIGFLNTIVLQPVMLTPEELGLYRILYQASLLIATFFPLGLNGLTIKYFPKFRNEANGHNGYFGLLIMVSLASYIFWAILIYFLQPLILQKYSNAPLFVEFFNFIFPMSLFIGFTSILSIYCYSLFKSSFPSFLSEIFIRLFSIIIVSLYFIKVLNFHTFICFYMASYGVQLILLIFYIFKVKALSIKVNWELVRGLNLREVARFGFVIAIATVASQALRTIDTLLLGSNLSKSSTTLAEVAVYTVALAIGNMIEAPSNGLSRIADTKVADAFSRNDFELVKTIYIKSTRMLMVAGGLLFIGLIINIHSFLSLLPLKYHTGETVVIIISISSFFNMATGVNSSIIYYSSKYIYGTYLLIGLLLTSVILYLILIPLYGIIGAAIATCSSLFLFNLSKYLLILVSFKLQPYGRYAVIVILLILLCAGVNYFLPHLLNPLIDILYRSAIIGVVYITIVELTGIAPEFKESIMSRLKKKAA